MRRLLWLVFFAASAPLVLAQHQGEGGEEDLFEYWEEDPCESIMDLSPPNISLFFLLCKSNNQSPNTTAAIVPVIADDQFPSASTTTTAPTTTTSASTTTTAPTTTTTKAQNTCDYSQFGANHTMLLPPKDTCKIGSRGVTEEEKAVILKVHNDFRNKVAKGEETQGDPGPQPAGANIRELVWNDQLAEVAQAWAEQCQNGHDKYYDRKICNRNYFYVGQNIYYSYNFDDASEWTKGITAWYNEVKNMPSSIVNSFASAPSGKVIGHYSQLVWAETNEIGCGGIVYSTERSGTTYPKSKVYVCNYGEGGNTSGGPMYVTGPAASQCGDKGVSTTYTGLCN